MPVREVYKCGDTTRNSNSFKEVSALSCILEIAIEINDDLPSEFENVSYLQKVLVEFKIRIPTSFLIQGGFELLKSIWKRNSKLWIRYLDTGFQSSNAKEQNFKSFEREESRSFEGHCEGSKLFKDHSGGFPRLFAGQSEKLRGHLEVKVESQGRLKVKNLEKVHLI